MENVYAAMTVLAVIGLWSFASFHGRNGLGDLVLHMKLAMDHVQVGTWMFLCF